MPQGGQGSNATTTGPGTPERRSDLLLRSIVHCCRVDLEPCGFQLDGRGSSGERSWVRFSRPAHDERGHSGTLTVLVAHGRREQALMADAYFVDKALDVHTPHARLLRGHDSDAELPGLIRRMVTTVCSWPN